MKVTVSRKAHFNAAHRLHNKNWDDATNEKIFGKCNNPNFHGHNYELIVHITGEVNPDTGYVIDMKILADIIYEEVEQAFDHKNLNVDVDDFKNLNPTAEHIAYVIYHKIAKRIDKSLELEVELYETPRNFVRYSGK
ncbi:6-pyruvoyl tetrahydropterin synthase family protein [Capnocytophaga sp. ARDL2]|uniref:6-pyruvoyl trahydropterin synthase family protein n=1 Tax=Capnocytophaga sp. ARDL2 TaxID=3238809 RepID=UPI00355683E3